MESSIIDFRGQQTFKWEVSPGDYIVWVRWQNALSPKSDITVRDFWEMRDGDLVSITSKIDDLPPWFELHPLEVAGHKACLMMQEKLASGYKPKEPVDGPNLWRVMTGDRVIWISGVEAQEKNPTLTLVKFRTNALVFGERRVHPNDLAWFLSFGAPVEESPSRKVAALMRAGLDNVRKLGLPNEIADIGSDWRLGSY